MSLRTKKWSFIALLIFIGVLGRWIPHPYNFTPIAALALFGGSQIRPWYLSFLIPMGALWFSDLVLMNVTYRAFYSGFSWFGHTWVYIGFGLVIGLGTLLKKITVKNTIGFSLGASLIFFLTSNFGVWLGSELYPQNLNGLIACYVAGLPFFGNSILGDLCYTSLFFGSFYWFKERYLQTTAVGQ